VRGIESLWWGGSPLAWSLAPLSWIFCAVAWVRRRLYRHGLLRSERLPVPVIVVGNITVGGTGKSPLVVWLVEWLRGEGYRPGVISRGYGGEGRYWPEVVGAGSDPRMVGEEPVLIARRTGCPLVAGPDRVAAARLLLERFDCDLIISDDGLQHYALGRAIEIAVVDGGRGLGNGLCLPAGPLRERPTRLAEVDLVVVNGEGWPAGLRMELAPEGWINLADPTRTLPAEGFAGERAHAVAGIGNPRRFFATLEGLGVEANCHPFPDHHRFSAEEISPDDALPVLMTEKDAVKCTPFAAPRHWYLRVGAQLQPGFAQRLRTLLEGVHHG